MTRYAPALAIFVVFASFPASAEEAPPNDDLSRLDAREAVRRGNEHLANGQAAEALKAYRHAEQLRPDAREIAFVEGLAHYDLKEFDKAREALRKAGGLAGDSLSDDSLYGLGAADHAEGLELLEEDPQSALSLLEGAMRKYHDILARRRDHVAARNANLKAATVWRQLKERLEQRQQPQQDQDQNEEQDDKQQQQKQDDQQQDRQPSEPQDQDDRQERKEQSKPEEQSEDQQKARASQAQQEEEVSREQAERRLREMMQAIRDRKKARREPAANVPVAPVAKDW